MFWTPGSDPVYPNVRQEFETVDGFPVVTAEAAITQGGTRTHRRMLGASPQWPVTYGKPIVYSDAYVTPSGWETYAYARHNVDLATFLMTLDHFFTQQREEFAELFPF